MKGKRGQILLWVTALVLCGLWVLPAPAADFPNRAVTLIVPWAAGGTTDLTMRALAEAAGKHLGQPVVVDNRAGGGGTVGPAAMAANARPDGYTLTVMHIALIRYPYMMKVSWDPLKDFSHILNVAGYTYGVVVKGDAPWKTWKDFVEYAKANPGKVTYATPGAGTTLHIMMEVIASREGIKWIQVPMKGGAETIAAVLGGHVSASADSTGWAPQVDSGDFRLLVTWGSQRTKRWPHVPTLKELGYGIVSSPPLGIAGPKGMDPKVVKVLHDAFKQGTEGPSFQKVLAKFDMVYSYMGTDEYVKFAKEQCELEKMYVEKLGLAKKE